MIKQAVPPFKTAKWVRSPAVEELFKSPSLTDINKEPLLVDIKHVRIDSLAVKKSLSNNARIGEPLDSEHVKVLAQSMEHGLPIDAVIVTKEGDIIGGNHRVNAAISNDYISVLAYVLSNATKETQDFIIRTDNAKHGKGYSDEERMQHALHLVAQGMTVVEVASHEGIPASDLDRRNESQKIRLKLENMGVDSSGLHHSTLYTLRPLEKTILEKAARIVINSKYNEKQTRKLVKRITDSPNKMAEIEKIRAEGIGPARSKKHRPIRDSFVNKLSSKNSLLLFLEKGNNGGGFTDLEQLQIYDEQELKEIKKSIRKLIKHLNYLK